jgi:hypothetical protein
VIGSLQIYWEEILVGLKKVEYINSPHSCVIQAKAILNGLLFKESQNFQSEVEFLIEICV